MTTYTIHPLADIFPSMSDDDFQALKADIEENGLREPCWAYQSQVIDGRHRLKACQELGIEPEFKIYYGDDPLGFVLSLNLHRRHLTESQRAMIGARLANLEKGRPSNDKQLNAQICAFNQTACETFSTQDEAAEALNISRRAVQQATKVKNEGVPELEQAVVDGKASVNAASAIASAPPEQQKAIVERVERGESTFAAEAKQIKSSPAAGLEPDIEPEEMITIPRAAYDDLVSDLEKTLAELEAYAKIVEADDKLKAAHDEIKRLTELNDGLELRIRGLMGENGEAIKAAKKYKYRADKLEKELKAAQSVDPAVGF